MLTTNVLDVLAALYHHRGTLELMREPDNALVQEALEVVTGLQTNWLEHIVSKQVAGNSNFLLKEMTRELPRVKSASDEDFIASSIEYVNRLEALVAQIHHRGKNLEVVEYIVPTLAMLPGVLVEYAKNPREVVDSLAEDSIAYMRFSSLLLNNEDA